jgi:hypothetical protein
MKAGAILARLEAAGLHLRADGGNLVVSPKEAVTDELRALMRSHKPELLAELQGRPAANGPVHLEPAVAFPIVQVHRQPNPEPSPLSGLDCSGCNNLDMRQEWHTGTRKVFFWRCKAGHELLQGRNYGERIVLAPPECEEAGDFDQWKPGTR